MATIDIAREHALPLDQAKAKAEAFAKSMEEKLGLRWSWAGDSIKFDAPSGVAKGAKGEVAVTGTSVRVLVDLPLMLRVMKGTIEDKIQQKLRELL